MRWALVSPSEKRKVRAAVTPSRNQPTRNQAGGGVSCQAGTCAHQQPAEGAAGHAFLTTSACCPQPGRENVWETGGLRVAKEGAQLGHSGWGADSPERVLLQAAQPGASALGASTPNAESLALPPWMAEGPARTLSPEGNQGWEGQRGASGPGVRHPGSHRLGGLSGRAPQMWQKGHAGGHCKDSP